MEGERFGLMSKISYLRCRKCQEPLKNHEQAYCKPCNLYLMYRAMPILLGMLMTGVIRADPILVRSQAPLFDEGLRGYECSDSVCWE